MAQEESITFGCRKDQGPSSQPNPSFKELNMNSHSEPFKRFVPNSATLTQPTLKYCLQFSLALCSRVTLFILTCHVGQVSVGNPGTKLECCWQHRKRIPDLRWYTSCLWAAGSYSCHWRLCWSLPLNTADEGCCFVSWEIRKDITYSKLADTKANLVLSGGGGKGLGQVGGIEIAREAPPKGRLHNPQRV